MIMPLDFLELVIATLPRFFLGLVAAGLRHRRFVRSPFAMQTQDFSGEAQQQQASKPAELNCGVTYEPLTSRKRR